MRKGERLEKLIENSKHKNVYRFSKEAGVPYTTLKSFIERDLEKASIDNVVKVAKELNVTVEHLIGEEKEGYSYSTMSDYAFYPTAISAGLPINVDGITNDRVEKISLPDSVMGKWAGKKGIFITKINGDSMDKVMPHGSLIAVKPVTLDELKDGDMVVFSDNYDYSVKCFYQDGDRLIFKPESYNKKHTDQIYSVNDGIEIHGKVVLYIVERD